MERSARVWTVVPWVTLLLELSGSEVDAETDAVLLIAVVRLGSTFTVRWTVVDAPLASAPMLHVTVPPDSVPPPSADTNEVPAGTASLIATPEASLGPPFVTVMV